MSKDSADAATAADMSILTIPGMGKLGLIFHNRFLKEYGSQGLDGDVPDYSNVNICRFL